MRRDRNTKVGVRISKVTGGAYADVKEVIKSELARIKEEWAKKMIWTHGKWADKEAYWHELNEYVTVLVRADGYNSDSDWKVKIHFGDSSVFVEAFKRSEIEQAKNVGIVAARKFLRELAA